MIWFSEASRSVCSLRCKKKQKNYELLSSASSTVPPVPVFPSSYFLAKRRALLVQFFRGTLLLSRHGDWSGGGWLRRQEEKGPEEARRVLNAKAKVWQVLLPLCASKEATATVVAPCPRHSHTKKHGSTPWRLEAPEPTTFLGFWFWVWVSVELVPRRKSPPGFPCSRASGLGCDFGFCG